MMNPYGFKVDLIQKDNTWNLSVESEMGSVFLPLRSSSSMPEKPKINSLLDLTGRLVLNLGHGRWRWSITIFKATGTVQSATWISPCTDCQGILRGMCSKCTLQQTL
nr:nonstructural protein NSs [Kaeng Khoi virus]